mgnify:CR=1 FL=1
MRAYQCIEVLKEPIASFSQISFNNTLSLERESLIEIQASLMLSGHI